MGRRKGRLTATAFGGGAVRSGDSRWAETRSVAPRNPAQYIVFAFFAASMVGTLLLMLPVATRSGRGAPLSTALFTSTSASCVTGLTLVDTGTYWSAFGHVVIITLIQIGGVGIMTLTSLLVMTLSRRLGLRQKLITAAQTGALSIGDVTSLVRAVVKLTIAVEAAVAAVLFLRFWAAHDESVGGAARLAGFHAVSAFNNAGFGLFADNLGRYRTDPVVLVAIMVALTIGALGVPVWRQIAAHRRAWRRWDLHTKITVFTTIGLVLVAWLLFGVFEWANPDTYGPLSTPDTVVNALFQSASTRTAGFHTYEPSALDDTSHLLSIILMFIGGGSGSAAGGIKVTTFALLGWVMWSEVRGDRDVEVFRRRVPQDIQRQALTVALMAVGVVVVASMLLLALTSFELAEVVFESVSALGTAGLSSGITTSLPLPASLVVAALMFVGRVGPPTLFAALVLRERSRLYRHPEERIIIG